MKTELLTWEGGEHEFALPLSALEALQDRMGGDGVGLIFQRVCSGSFKSGDVINTLVFGLEGAGLKKAEAYRIVNDVYEERGLNCMALTAQIVLATSLNGWPDDEDESQGEAEVETLNLSE